MIMNKKTRALTEEQYRKIITTINEGFVTAAGERVKPNSRIATALTLLSHCSENGGQIEQFQQKFIFISKIMHSKITSIREPDYSRLQSEQCKDI